MSFVYCFENTIKDLHTGGYLNNEIFAIAIQQSLNRFLYKYLN